MKVRNTVIAGLGALFVFGLGAPAMADGDAAAGKKVFAKCRACHKLEAGKHGVGPSLHNIVGREVATADGFTKYSKAMKAFGEGKTWDEDLLNSFLEKPKGLVKGTKMAFPGLRKPEQRADVIAYLKSVE
ncbi:cytochrome c family protein [Hwanghaeella grinnelliae]|uniref:Cytochrome c family protein n=1 Tax=Hwanghaeella grinnelliae TaxID=2500179 RepID=A0A3S3ULW3_9PROT|nr:cytochrome c family protein [Hwanghaeella grinnelliae]RVU34604.1 cytochrome c family protein [Hwanghaeella grinnelliae]